MEDEDLSLVSRSLMTNACPPNIQKYMKTGLEIE